MTITLTPLSEKQRDEETLVHKAAAEFLGATDGVSDIAPPSSSNKSWAVMKDGQTFHLSQANWGIIYGIGFDERVARQEAIAAFTNKLYQRGFPTSRLATRPNGNFVAVYDGNIYTLEEQVEGARKFNGTDDDIASAATLLAYFHEVTKNLDKGVVSQMRDVNYMPLGPDVYLPFYHETARERLLKGAEPLTAPDTPERQAAVNWLHHNVETLDTLAVRYLGRDAIQAQSGVAVNQADFVPSRLIWTEDGPSIMNMDVVQAARPDYGWDLAVAVRSFMREASTKFGRDQKDVGNLFLRSYEDASGTTINRDHLVDAVAYVEAHKALRVLASAYKEGVNTYLANLPAHAANALGATELVP